MEHGRVAVLGLPNWAEAHLVLANALYKSGEKNEALVHYKEAARLSPELPTAARNARLLEAELGRRE